MRVLLIPPKSNYPSPSPCFDLIGQAFPYLAGALRAAGHQVRAVNLSYLHCEAPPRNVLDDAIHRACLDFEPQLIGVGGMSPDIKFIRDAIDSVRTHAPHVPIVLGGPIISYDGAYIFRTLRPDFALKDEAEHTLIALIDGLTAGADLGVVPNLHHWVNGTAVFNIGKPTNAPLDTLPLPDYEPFDFEAYLDFNVQSASNICYTHTRQRPRTLPISMGRSCPYRCTFCCHHVGPSYRMRTIENAVAEIRQMYERYRFNLLFILDELFAVNAGRLLEWSAAAEALRKEGLDFDWTCALKVNHAVAPNVLAAMKRAGCMYIGYGLESMSPDVLKSMRKKITRAQIETALVNTEAAGLGIQGNFIFGDPAETVGSMDETWQFFATKCRHHAVSLGYVTPYPGSQLFELALASGAVADRAAFYEALSSFGSFNVNLTRIPDLTFREAVEGYLTTSSRPDFLPPAEVLACSAIDTYPPYPRPAAVYLLRVCCPYCQNEVAFRYGLTVPPPCRAEVICPQCHKRSQAHIGLPNQENAAPHQVQSGQKSGPTLPQAPTMLASPLQAEVLAAMAEQFARPGCRFLEVGSWTGDTTLIWAAAAQRQNGKVYCVDWWLGNDDTELHRTAREHDVFAEFWTRIQAAGLTDTVVPIRCRSDVAAEILRPGTFDLVFIDADHRYESVAADIAAFKPLVRNGGLLCGHDCEGRIGDFPEDLLKLGKDTDYHETVHCGVVLAVGHAFQDYSINEAVWSVIREGESHWSASNLQLPPRLQARQALPPPAITTQHYQLYRYGFSVHVLPRTEDGIDIRDPSALAAAGGQTLPNMAAALATVAEPPLRQPIPKLLETFCSFNIVAWQERYFAVANAAGPVNLMSASPALLEALARSGELITSESLATVKSLAALHHRRTSERPRLPQQVANRIAAIVRSVEETGIPVCLYGAGEHTRLLFTSTALRSDHVTAIFDRNPDLYWTTLFDLLILPAEAAFEARPERIVISSPRFESQIMDYLNPLRDLGTCIERLYDTETSL